MSKRTPGAPAPTSATSATSARKGMDEKERDQYIAYINNMFQFVPDDKLRLVYFFTQGLTNLRPEREEAP